MIKQNSILLLLAMTMAASISQAQVADTVITVDSLSLDSIPLSEGINVDDVEVIKAFSAKLDDANSIKMQPILPTTPPRNVQYDYDVTIVPLELSYPDPVIKPYAMRPDPVQDQYRGFIEAGYGTVRNPHARAGYSLANEKFELKAIAGYDALDNTEQQFIPKMENIYGDVVVTVPVGDKHQYVGHLTGGIASYAVYDQRQNVPMGGVLEIVDRHIDRVALTNSWGTKTPNNGWRYNANLTASYIQEDFNDRSEVGGLMGLQASKSQSELVSYHLDGRLWAYSVTSEDGDNLHSGAHLTPYLRLQRDSWWANIGADVFLEDNPVFWPNFEVGLDIGKGTYQPYLGSRLNTEVNSNNHLIRYNPYVDIVSPQTTASRSIYVGMRGQVSRLSYDASASYDQVTDHIFYNPDWPQRAAPVFQAIYLDANVVTVTAHAEIKLVEHVAIGGTLRQRIFDMADEDASPWGQPLFELDAYSEINLLEERLLVRPQLSIASIATYDIEQNPANGLADLSIHADYKVGGVLTIYAQANNLLDNEYQRWVDYPTVGINFAGGLKVKF